ncbi:MAG TPA: hypothetical protein VMR54_03025 [Thermoanaerobaculia bacterium]|nr:hypothetical protein [Thermoanaerobaculia bacterium]
MREALRSAVALARETRTPLYVAGGAVRDALLDRPVRDLDAVVEGDALGFARKLARRLDVSVREHARFGTATLELPEARALDVAMARGETYEHPGALPRVHPGSITEDLARRDFTVNAMAWRLEGAGPRFCDPQAGLSDLRRGLIRMLHAASPRDDPTRAFRAVLYANRLGFRIEPRTRRWIRQAVDAGAVDRISGDRLRREVARILSEPGRARAVSMLSALGLSAALHPSLRGDAQTRARLSRAERLAASSPSGTSWLAYLLVWAADLPAEGTVRLARRLNLSRQAARTLERWPERRPGGSSRDASPFSPDEALAVAALGATDSEAGETALRIRGRDLVAAGIPPGPALGRALGATRRARRLGRISAEEELAFAVAAARDRQR